MRIYVVRHAQPNFDGIGNVDITRFSPKDPELTPKGIDQAKCLAEALYAKGFNGPILSSPYRRALETAHYTAERCGVGFEVEPEFQEIAMVKGLPDFDGMTAEAIEQEFDEASCPDGFVYPWFKRGVETMEDVKARISSLLNRILNLYSYHKELLLVGHWATVHACKEVLLKNILTEDFVEPPCWNCSLSMYEFDTEKQLSQFELFDSSHMPDAMITSNNYLKL